MSVDVYTLTGSEDDEQELIAALTFGLTSAVEAELVSPENETNILAWMKAQSVKRHPQVQYRPLTVRDVLGNSPLWPFWSTLEEGQEVRWLGAKAQTYFCVTGHLQMERPAGDRAHSGPWIELRRHTGKTFWSTVFKVRPLEDLTR